ncbi:hypothetical protein F2Q70_00002363 [Brassica cretica]|uniref:F-box associated beta-propeller type 3 domain-containing protein n=1 Tax=Brassica cretica TaxID=69181 RepID=A0A8S9ISG5_BRACR|nr:hypothetical protein F2Q70_00002363 [Brassica cretica]
MHMIASFNGLVCCINQLSDEHEVDYQIWICNPSTEETLLLPQGRPSVWTEPSIGVAYGPDISEYKIFRIFCVGKRNAGKGDYLYECEVYSSSTGAWRSIGPVLHLPMYVCFSPHRSDHVFAGGKIYWLVSLEDPAGIMLSVDMEENFEVMELPYYSTDLRDEDRITVATYLINLGGSLSLASPLRFGDFTDFLKLQPSSVTLDISNSLIRGSLDEGTLDLLEKHLLRQRSVITESHKSAYCTFRFMWPLSASHESGSGLVRDDLLKWEIDLKKAFEDPEMYQRIRETNIRFTAISFLNQLLQEQLGICSVAQRRYGRSWRNIKDMQTLQYSQRGRR